MRDGFIKVAAAVPSLKVADAAYNAGEILRLARGADAAGAVVTAFPELCLTGYTCGDLFLQETLLRSAEEELGNLLRETAEIMGLIFVGVPVCLQGKLYNCTACLHRGRLLALVPKTHLPNYAEFYEARQFTPGPQTAWEVTYAGQVCRFGTRTLFTHEGVKELIVGAELCEDLWTQSPPSLGLCAAGATLIVNPSASPESIGKPEYRRDLVRMHSAAQLCAYLYAGAGEEESTTDLIYSGHSLIAENGLVLAERQPFSGEGLLLSEVDVRRLVHERRRMTDFVSRVREDYAYIPFDTPLVSTALTRDFPRTPFVPRDPARRHERCRQILRMQAGALAKRLRHTGSRTALVGISGGLDSTWALLVTAEAFQILGKPLEGLLSVTMPCFGTGTRTRANAEKLSRGLGARFMEIDITPAVRQHLKDLGHDEATYDVTFENAQARERTQVLMDLSNQEGGIVVGTGDLSEIALGWSTYNGDHMSMYGVNAGVPKTLMRYLVGDYADHCPNADLSATLLDILDTPVSPELVPSQGEELQQKTESILGDYELHDFFLYYAMRWGFSPDKLYRVAVRAFVGIYEKDMIQKTLGTFYRRFFSQQFKRSCMPDGVKIGSVALSPRGDWRMPSDAEAAAWIRALEAKEN